MSPVSRLQILVCRIVLPRVLKLDRGLIVPGQQWEFHAQTKRMRPLQTEWFKANHVCIAQDNSVVLRRRMIDRQKKNNCFIVFRYFVIFAFNVSPLHLPSDPCYTQTKASSFLRHTCPHTSSSTRLKQAVRWCFELLMKLASVPGSRGEGKRRGWERGRGVCFQKLKPLLTWGQRLDPSESCSRLLTQASVGTDALMETEILMTRVNLCCAQS